MAKGQHKGVIRMISGGVTAACGFEAAGVRGGLKSAGPDVALIYTVTPAVSAGVFTTNRFQAAPVLVSKERVGRERVHAVIVNAGNANACTGAKGFQDARRMSDLTADALGAPAQSVLVASTGVIGRPLPMVKVATGIKKAVAALSPTGSDDAAVAIMTTDTRPKSYAVEFNLDGRPVRVGGIAKGSGMISPHMATMLGFITTDAHLSAGALQSSLVAAVEKSFHRITVDGDTSTNDCVLLLANGQSEAGRVTPSHGLATFQAALDEVCVYLAKEIARDGEGATKLVAVQVVGAASDREAHTIARTIANSPLVKTALAGGDPNWGRILAAAGRARVRFQPDLIELHLGKVRVVKEGAAATFSAASAAKAVSGAEVNITLDLHTGRGQATVWTCDFTADYVKINADYHT